MATISQEKINIWDALNQVYNLTKITQEEQLLNTIKNLYGYYSYPNCRVMVFGSFNQGKSTLFNALLGQKILPTDLIPTTGAMIKVTHGSIFQTCIKFSNGDKLEEKGSAILEEFTRLNENRKMRDDIETVTVFMPHPLLKSGVDLYDLPGTNDQEEQDLLVKNQLLTADLVIQVLDATKLFTLKEVEDLHYWLLNEGIKNVIFVVNFANLLEEEEQDKVMRRATLLAEDFYSPLFRGFSNIYRVDALPAFKARKKGDYHNALASGLLTFEDCFSHLVTILYANLQEYRLPRLQVIINQLEASLISQQKTLENEIISLRLYHQNVQQKLEEDINLILCKFANCLHEFRRFLQVENLVNLYQEQMIDYLKNNNFNDWVINILQPVIESKIKSLQQLVLQGENISKIYCDKSLSLDLPTEIQINVPEVPPIEEPRTGKSVGIAAGIGWFVLGPIGAGVAAAATHYVNENHKRELEMLWNQYRLDFQKARQEATKNYLSNISVLALKQLNLYEKKVSIVFQINQVFNSQELLEKEEKLKTINQIMVILNRNEIVL